MEDQVESHLLLSLPSLVVSVIEISSLPSLCVSWAMRLAMA